MKHLAATGLALALASMAACSGGGQALPSAPSVSFPDALHDESGGANPTVYITNDGFKPRKLEILPGQRVTFVNQLTNRPPNTTAWIRADPHEPTGHNECPQFVPVGMLAPGQIGHTLAFAAGDECDYHDHNMLAELTSDFEGEIRARDDDDDDDD